MTILIYNTLTGKKEPFEPLEPGKVHMYVCGPTVYDSCHIGHARSVVVFDVIARYLRNCGFDVTDVRNFTDVDDKIINKANQLGVDSTEVAERYIHEFYEDMDALQVERPTIEPRATAHMHEMIHLIELLIKKGRAYQIENDVFYAVESFDAYGKLSGRKLDEMTAGARVDIDARKRNPFDFALWKSAKPGEPSWDSPWGKGRPGWHIECSAMSWKHLGKTLDIHGGGKDLVFPHHENEIAQSEGAFEKPFANYWVHNGFVNINHEKMSKSLGNFLMIKDIVKTYHPEALRLFLLSNHYRSPIDYSEQAMEEANSGLDKIYKLFKRMEEKNWFHLPEEPAQTGDCWNQFDNAMHDDFNTAKGIGTLFETVHKINRLLDQNDVHHSPEVLQTIQTARTDIVKAGHILGIANEPQEAYFAEKQSRGLSKTSIDPETIQEMLKERTAARKAKNWRKADQIRQQLESMNIVIQDRPDGGTDWEIKK